MSILANDDNAPRREAEILTNPTQVILDTRNDIQKFQDGGPRSLRRNSLTCWMGSIGEIPSTHGGL
jgi:hypothetical protein